MVSEDRAPICFATAGPQPATSRRPGRRWVRDVLVWSRAPLLFPNELMAIDGLAGEVRAAEPGDGRERPLGVAASPSSEVGRQPPQAARPG
jgi:hypothetical protein